MVHVARALLLSVLVAFAASSSIAEAVNPGLRLDATIVLPQVKGRIDHMSVDVPGKRLFVAALGNDTIEVIDVEKNQHQRSLRGFGEPQGVLYVADKNRLYVANGNGNRVDILDGTTFEARKHIEAKDADNLRFDSAGAAAIVGYGGGALRVIDTSSENTTGQIELPAHPEGFQLERNGARIFVNVPNARQVAVVDKTKRGVIAAWPTPDAASNFPMALDEANARLFVGTRRPPLVLVYDTGTGKVVARLPIGEDTDDLFVDAQRKRLYVVCGEGRIDVFQREEPERYVRVESVKTAPKARTGLFVPEYGRLYVAAPAGGAGARILVYAVDGK